ncbi:ABC transporter permease subunit [Actinocatenispora rupis]|uniref:ABC transporter permease n=1 Tax=Actinocatenispora rupis TaxID=519421 RepID=A0A8J3NCP9_9ACTN|nr:ABC transporter permease [Actinocatenispora rupis]
MPRRWTVLVAAAALLVVTYLAVRSGRYAAVTYLATQPRQLDPSASALCYYAARSMTRMFEALGLSLVFSLAFGYAAARSRRLERVLVPALDILQSVPVLGLLAVSAPAVIELVPGSVLDQEAVAVFAVFCAQAWHMAFAFYQSLIMLPPELDELSRGFRFPRWLRFVKVELPHAAIALVWNGMMGFASGWFFLAVSEAVTVAGSRGALPGVGSYAAQAIADGDPRRLLMAMAAMAVLVLAAHTLFWRPVAAWAERFRVEDTGPPQRQRSAVLDRVRRPAALPVRVRQVGADLADRAGRIFGTDGGPVPRGRPTRPRGAGTGVLVAAVAAVAVAGVAGAVWGGGPGLVLRPLLLGVPTLLRVAAVVVVATLVWVPIGVRIGLSPRLTRVAQPVILLLASFPANFLYPAALWLLARTGVPLDVGGTLLMALSAQWYVLFNTVAGATAIPTDLRQATTDLGVRGLLRWRTLIAPAIFPYWLTGAISAAGSAWNASIIAEVVSFGGHRIVADGLGALIAEAARTADFPALLAAVTVVTLYVALLHHLLWRRLYRYARRRFAVG